MLRICQALWKNKNELFFNKGKRFVYLNYSGHETPSEPEADKEAAPATPEDAQKAEGNYYEQQAKLTAEISDHKKDDNPKIRNAAMAAERELDKLSREPNLSETQRKENLNKIRGELNYQLNIGKFEQDREPLKKALDDQMKIKREEPMQNINKILNSPAYANLSPDAKKILTAKVKDWTAAYDKKINGSFFALTQSKAEIRTNTLQNPDYFTDLNANLEICNQKLKNPKALDEEFAEINMNFNIEAQNIALSDLAERPGQLDDHIREGVEKVLAALNAQAEKADEAGKAAIEQKKEQAKKYGTEALNMLGGLMGQGDQPKRAVILAKLRDQMSSLVRGLDHVGYRAAIAMAKDKGLADNSEGRMWLSAAGIDIPQEQSSVAETDAESAEKKEKPPEETAAPKSSPEAPAKTIPERTVYQDAISQLRLLESGEKRVVDFMMRIQNIDTPLQAVKMDDGTFQLRWASDRKGGVGFFRFKDVDQMIKETQNGMLMQKFTAAALSNRERYKLYEDDVSHVNELTRSQDGTSVNLELDWKGIFDGKGNPLIKATARPHGMIEYTIKRRDIGLHGEDSIAGFANNFDDFMKQLRHFRNWAEESLHESKDKNAVAREAAFRDISNPRTYETHADRIGRTVYFGIQTTESKTDQKVKMFLDWGNSPDRDIKMNPLVSIAVNDDGTIRYRVLSENSAFKMDNKVMRASMQDMMNDLAAIREKAGITKKEGAESVVVKAESSSGPAERPKSAPAKASEGRKGGAEEAARIAQRNADAGAHVAANARRRG